MEDFQIEALTDVIAPDQNVSKRNLLYEFGQSGGNGSKSGTFVLQITDPSDPMFLYDYQLNPQDYPALKEELNLFGEYPGFSRSVYDLLTNCVNKEDHMAVIDQHKYDTPTLLLQQKTQMALLTPFKVPLVPASAARLNHFLTSEVDKYKSLFLEREQGCNNADEEIEELNKRMEEMKDAFQERFSKQEEKNKQAMDTLEQKYENQIAEMKSKAKQSAQEALAERQKSEADLTNKYETVISDLRQQIKQINEDKTREMLQKVSNEEKIKSLEKQVADLTAAKAQLELEKNSLSSQLTQISSDSTEYKTKVDSANSSISILKETAAHNQQLISASNKQIEKMQEEIAKKDEEIAKLIEKGSVNEKKVQEHDWIISKSKQVIEKFLAEAKEHRSEIYELRAELDDKDNEMKEIQIQATSDKATIEAQKENIERVCHDNKSLSLKIAELEDNIKELESKITSDESTISLLNKRLNNYEINGDGTAGNIDLDDNFTGGFSFDIPSSTKKETPNKTQDLHPMFQSPDIEPENIWETTFF